MLGGRPGVMPRARSIGVGASPNAAMPWCEPTCSRPPACCLPAAFDTFITAGAVSSIPAAIAGWALVKKRVFVLYLALGLVGSMITAWVYQLSGGAI